MAGAAMAISQLSGLAPADHTQPPASMVALTAPAVQDETVAVATPSASSPAEALIDVLVAAPEVTAAAAAAIVEDNTLLANVGVIEAQVTAEQLERLIADGHTVDVDIPVSVTGAEAVAGNLLVTPPGVRRIGARPLPPGGFDRVKVAVFDTGVADDHRLNLTDSYDCLDGSCISRTAGDVNGHGTMTAGIVGAAGSGVAPGVEIVSYQVMSHTGQGSALPLIRAIDHAIGRGDIDLINLSLAGEATSIPTLEQALDRANAAGITVVASAGNDGGDADLRFPGNMPQTISVSAIADYDGEPGGRGTSTAACAFGNPDDQHATFTNLGSTVDVTAPGVCTQTLNASGQTVLYTGTSASAPHVTGVAAHLLATEQLEASPDRPDEVRRALTDRWAARVDGECGYTPRDAASEPLVMIGGCPDPTTPPADEPSVPRDVSAVAGDRAATLTWSAPSSDGGSPLTGYLVDIDPAPSIGSATRTTTSRNLTVTGLTNDQTYSFTVYATNAVGTSLPVVATATPTAPTAPPPDPSSPGRVRFPDHARLMFDVHANARGLTLRWPAATDAERYTVHRNGTQVASTTARSIPVTGLTPGRAADLEVRAHGADGRTVSLQRTVTLGASFRDVPSSHRFHGDIRWLAAANITRGNGSGSYDPQAPVTRGQMAAFLSRGLELTATTGVRFSDVPPGSTFATDIDKLFTARVTRGSGPGTFSPNAPVTRGQMAAFLSRALELDVSSGIRFPDVPSGSTFAADIDRLATARITEGRSDGTFGPSERVTRAQMAAFLHRALNRDHLDVR